MNNDRSKDQHKQCQHLQEDVELEEFQTQSIIYLVDSIIGWPKSGPSKYERTEVIGMETPAPIPHTALSAQ